MANNLLLRKAPGAILCVYKWGMETLGLVFRLEHFLGYYCTAMAHTAVGCFKVKDVESRNGVSRPEMMSISQKYQNLCLKRGAWDPDEDQILRAYIMRYGTRNWNEMPKAAGN
jgi:hypothetical protein